MEKDVKDFVSVIREIVSDYTESLDNTQMCRISGKNSDGTYDISLISDENNKITHIINESSYNFKVGDYALVYLIKNRLSNSFIIAKQNPNVITDLRGGGAVENITNITEIHGGGGGGIDAHVEPYTEEGETYYILSFVK